MQHDADNKLCRRYKRKRVTWCKRVDIFTITNGRSQKKTIPAFFYHPPDLDLEVEGDTPQDYVFDRWASSETSDGSLDRWAAFESSDSSLEYLSELQNETPILPSRLPSDEEASSGTFDFAGGVDVDNLSSHKPTLPTRMPSDDEISSSVLDATDEAHKISSDRDLQEFKQVSSINLRLDGSEGMVNCSCDNSPLPLQQYPISGRISPIGHHMDFSNCCIFSEKPFPSKMPFQSNLSIQNQCEEVKLGFPDRRKTLSMNESCTKSKFESIHKSVSRIASYPCTSSTRVMIEAMLASGSSSKQLTIVPHMRAARRFMPIHEKNSATIQIESCDGRTRAFKRASAA